MILAGCSDVTGPVGVDPDETGGGGGKADGASASAVPDVRCDGAPDAGPTVKFHHFRSRVVVGLGDPAHRGFDLVASAGAEVQTLAGAISYSLFDKALEDEDVDLFACRAGAWQRVGTARTDDEGRFALALTGDDRLPIGMRDLFVSVAGDRTGARFLAYVAPEGSPLIVSDVDGTLTASESDFLQTIVLGLDAGVRPDAADAYATATARGYQLVYVTARGQQHTEATRGWLERMGFPRGPVRLSPSFVTLPGGDTVDYKAGTFDALVDAGFELAAGVGNRASDIDAYAAAGVAADRIFIERPEFALEVDPEVEAGRAIGFDTYAELRDQHLSSL